MNPFRRGESLVVSRTYEVITASKVVSVNLSDSLELSLNWPRKSELSEVNLRRRSLMSRMAGKVIERIDRAFMGALRSTTLRSEGLDGLSKLNRAFECSGLNLDTVGST